MSRIPSTGSIGQQQAPGATGGDLSDLKLDQFLKLMIAELQNQDPLDPADNAEILQQISQIREINATDQLTNTLTAVLAGQNLTTASSLIGKEVKALSDSGENVQGAVDRVSIDVDDDNQRTLSVHIGGNSVRLENVREIVSPQ